MPLKLVPFEAENEATMIDMTWPEAKRCADCYGYMIGADFRSQLCFYLASPDIGSNYCQRHYI